MILYFIPLDFCFLETEGKWHQEVFHLPFSHSFDTFSLWSSLLMSSFFGSNYKMCWEKEGQRTRRKQKHLWRRKQKESEEEEEKDQRLYFYSRFCCEKRDWSSLEMRVWDDYETERNSRRRSRQKESSWDPFTLFCIKCKGSRCGRKWNKTLHENGRKTWLQETETETKKSADFSFLYSSWVLSV